VTAFFWDSLEAGGGRTALITDRESVSYARLSERVECLGAELRALLPADFPRPLVLLEAMNELDSIVAYLACLRARFPVILVAKGQAAAPSTIASSYEPNLVLRREAGTFRAALASSRPAPMHAELALLLSTSGTTGAAKLVRLSRANLQANASSIAEYLGLSSSERALTALQYHYSYGMSVLHTHLLSHASLVLTSASLMEEELWSFARQQGVTSMALVPTQFELLQELSFSKPERLPTLRYITQAGGKLDPRLALEFTRRAQLEGWQLFIMYGQTEAGPRISYVPPEDAERWYHSIGRAIPGGSLRVIDATGAEITRPGEPGELVYEGPNVMLGYALSRADLDAPAGPPLLRTGDIAERLENGYFKITGRTSRFVKLFGLRVGLDEVENALRSEGQRVCVSGSDERLVVFQTAGAESAALRTLIAQRYHLPERVVAVVRLDALPLLPSGKVDYRELQRRALALPPAAGELPADLGALLRCALGQASLDPAQSFVELGGSSLTYLEVQLLLSRRLGSAPEGWERLPLGQLFSLEKGSSRADARWQRVPADLLVRSLAVLAVIALHSTTWKTGGGSILLLILVGYSLARFQSEPLFAGQVGKTLWGMLSRIVGVYYVCIAVAALKLRPFDVRWFLLVANFDALEPEDLGPYWFVSTYVQVILLAALPFLLAPVRARVKAAPFATGVLALVVAAIVIQLSPVHAIYYNVRHHHPLVALELVLGGWCTFFARTTQQKLVAMAAILLVWQQNYGPVEANIAVLMLGGSFATLWGLQASLPRPAARALLLFGSLSMFVYVAHVPALYVLGRWFEPSATGFLVLVSVSLALAVLLKQTSDLVMQRLAR
jgi:acyl-CoA synthetase (AMP-forming)/AMP-acid ligase II/peptidoglycan/LPS O-acetylase OafA/YrhL